MADLFSHRGDQLRSRLAPLADRLRPRSLDEFQGQEEILGPGRLLRRAITDRLRAAGEAGDDEQAACDALLG